MKKYFAILLITIVSLNSFSQNIKRMGFVFDTRTYSFGDVEQWINQAAIFTFTNKTKHPVTILPIFNENDLEVLIPEKPIKVGETILIKAKYYTDGKGPFNRKFNIYFGSLDKAVELRITGNIKSLSPEAYIQCPMSRPELAKAKIDLIGDVAELDTEIPLSGTTIEIIGLQNNKQITLFSNSKGRFAQKLPVGNYQIVVKHPNYVTYSGPFYVGQTSPPLRIRLTPLEEFSASKIPNKIEKTDYEKPLYKKENSKKEEEKKPLEKRNEINNKDETNKNNNPNKNNDKPKTNNGLERNIDYVKNEPKDNPYSSNKDDKNNENISEIPKTLTTYKESENEDVNKPKSSKNKNIEEENDKDLEVADLENKPNTIKQTHREKENNDKTFDGEDIEDKEPNTIKQSPKDKENNNETYASDEPNKNPKTNHSQNNNPNVVNTNKYTFRVIDEKTLEPISSSSIFVYDIYDKKNKHKGSTNERGYSEMEIAKSDYRFIASANGYISNEIRILKDDKSDVYRIMLSPISDLFDQIYEAKKAEQKDEDVLERLSFGRNTLSFQNTEAETDDNEPNLDAIKQQEIEQKRKEDSLNLYAKEIELENRNKEIELAKAQKEKEDSLKLYAKKVEMDNAKRENELERIAQAEKAKQAKEKEDSLNRIIKQLALENAEKEKNLQKIENEKLAEFKKQREKEKLDSLNNYIALLQEKNNKLETDLDKVNTEKKDLEYQQFEKEKLADLEAKEATTKEQEPILSKTKYAANNIIFLIDVSTSMEKNRKIEMLKESIKNLAKVLRDVDRVAIISYNQKTNVVLESVSGNNTEDIIRAIDSLQTGGLTNGVRGITSAYEMLEYYFIPDGNNQIILATDGLFSRYNNEMTENELNKLVKKQAAKNMKLTVVGFGKDKEGQELMVKLAKNGTGQYIQIKNEWMTKDILIKEIQLNSKK